MRVVDNSMRVSQTLKSLPVVYSYGNTSLCTGEGGLCIIGDPCSYNSDCQSLFCNDAKCAEPSCNDSIKNGGEVDLDCGAQCDKCAIGKSCYANSDCETDNCVDGKCSKASTCINEILDGDETDLNCGGSCNGCNVGQKCMSNSDCSSANCRMGEESGICFNPGVDSDKDGLLDENDNCPGDVNPEQEDFDGDSIGDICDSDNDNDKMPDEWEIAYGLNPRDPSDADSDLDGDGLLNLEEFYPIGTNPTEVDTDGDGYSDYDEVKIHGTDPTDKDSYPKSKALFFVISIIFMILCILAGYYVYYAKENNWTFDFLSKKEEPIKEEVRPEIHHDENVHQMMPLPKKKPVEYKKPEPKQEEILPLSVREGLARMIKPKSYVDRLNKGQATEGMSRKLGLDKVVVKDKNANAVDSISRKIGPNIKADMDSLSSIVKKKKQGTYENLGNLAKTKGIKNNALDELGKGSNSENALKDLNKLNNKKEEDAFSKLRRKK